MASLREMLFGRREKFQERPMFDPQQQQLLSQILGGIGAPLGAGMENIMQILSGDPEALEAFQAPAMRQFQEQIIPSIAERFSGFGAGAQRSSAFQQALGGAGASLSERLSAQRAGLQQQSMQQLMGLLGPALSPQQQQIYRAPTGGFLGAMAPGIGGGVGMGLGVGLGARLLPKSMRRQTNIGQLMGMT